jgi:hypothetical protein
MLTRCLLASATLRCRSELVSVSVFVLSSLEVTERAEYRLRLLGCTVAHQQRGLRAWMVCVNHPGVDYLRVWTIVHRLDVYAWPLIAATTPASCATETAVSAPTATGTATGADRLGVR